MEKNTYPKGKFIVFEGMDGSGKDTQVAKISERLHDNCIPHDCTFEPSDSPVGKLIRDILEKKYTINTVSLELLFMADRINHTSNINDSSILKSLNEGVHVLCNRYYLSGITYGGTYAKHLFQKFQSYLIKPDLTIYLDLEPEISLQRINQNRDNNDIYENIDKLKDVRNKFITYIEELKFFNNENIITIDASKDIDTITDEIFYYIMQTIKGEEYHVHTKNE